jgi:hypothetical protein
MEASSSFALVWSVNRNRHLIVNPVYGLYEVAMNEKLPLSITFDSNVWEEIADLDKLKCHASSADLQTIRSAIEAKRVHPFISDVVLFLESVKEVDRERHFKGVTTKTTNESDEIRQTPDGKPEHHIKFNLKAVFPQVNYHPKLAHAFEEALKLGFKLIDIPRVAFPRYPNEYYKAETEEELMNRRDLVEMLGEFERAGIGHGIILRMADEVFAQDPMRLRYGGIKANPYFAFAEGDPSRIPSAVAEWADGDALAAHYQQWHDIFCTFDRGRKAGKNSVLHESRRDWLKSKFGIVIMSPTELAGAITN